MTPLPKKRLHELIDQLPEDQVEPVERYLSSLCNDDDPVMRAMRSAPVDDEELTHNDREAIEEGRQEIAAGRAIPDHQVRRKLGL